MYDYLFGGKDNFAVDREAAARMLEIDADIPCNARANRRFLARAVRSLAERGLTQFIDLGSGIPTSPNVHEIVRPIRPDARIVYVDNDLVVTAYNRALNATRGEIHAAEDVYARSGIRIVPRSRETIAGYLGAAAPSTSPPARVVTARRTSSRAPAPASRSQPPGRR